jgi:hypothetical protein
LEFFGRVICDLDLSSLNSRLYINLSEINEVADSIISNLTQVSLIYLFKENKRKVTHIDLLMHHIYIMKEDGTTYIFQPNKLNSAGAYHY